MKKESLISWHCKECCHYCLGDCLGEINSCEDFSLMEVFPEYFD